LLIETKVKAWKQLTAKTIKKNNAHVLLFGL
jgi:hypothetical protein